LIIKEVPEQFRDPESYMEVEGYDVRLAINKANDFIRTLGDARLSLLYADKEEHQIDDERLLNIIRRVHIRHAVMDYNNCFDILLQVPWFLFRAWKSTNHNGFITRKYKRKVKKRNDVIRNKEGWVEKAESKCNTDDLIEHMKSLNITQVTDLADKITSFNNLFRFDNTRKVVIREIANKLKHKQNLKLEEFKPHTSLNLNINGHSGQLGDNHSLILTNELFQFDDEEKETTVKSKIEYNRGDVFVDLEYVNGELFRGKDLIYSSKYYTIDDIYDELVSYHNNIIDLYLEVQKVLNVNASFHPQFEKLTISRSTSYNMDMFFKAKQSEKTV